LTIVLFRPTNLEIQDWVLADSLKHLAFEPSVLAIVKYKQR